MQKYDDIIVGSGISGLTMSLILAMNGRKALLLEKGPHIGGSMARFYKQGIPFDTGFHFTGGLHKGGILYDILSVLEIRDMIQPLFLSEDNANCFIFESENKLYEIPYGVKRIKQRLKEYFPEEASAIDAYFDKVQYVCDHTPSMNLRTLRPEHGHINEDFITLEAVLNGLTGNPALKALLSGFAMCYGVKPQEISFANHSRICLGLYESVARVRDGGTAFIKAFKTRLKELNVEIKCGNYIAELTDIRDNKAGRFVLNTGEEVAADNCIFTIHPMEIMKVLPEKYLSKAFINRVSSFEPSTGFFSVFAALDPEYEEPDFDSSLITMLPAPDINLLLEPALKGDSAIVLIKSIEKTGGKTHKIINSFEPSSMKQVEAWKDSITGNRPKEYDEYKNKKVENTLNRIFRIFPEYKDRLKVVDAATVLTFRDYLNNYDGSAYGIKQKVGQYSLRGRLPLHNLYAAGQSSLLPGIIGAMMSSFIVARSLVKEEQYNTFLSKNLCS
ncbi:MAG: NAD(P)/FAD-dependent oxidoreductase [Deltaproteobacteria bacterium]|nr:NAD(P)/FAD-dependent oxidoreductase [Deltaproteobacteria bacterium]